VKRFVLSLIIALCASVAVAHTDGIYNPIANSVGDTQGIDSNAATTANLTSLNGSAAFSNAGGTSVPITLSTTKTNDVIIVFSQGNGNVATGISDTAGLTWTQIGTQTGTMAAWSAFSAGILTGDVITITYAGVGSSFASLIAFGINGAPSSGFLDPNGALPGTTNTISTPLTLTTSNAKDFLFAAYSANDGTTMTAGAGWTAVPGTGGNFMFAEYQIVTTTQSALAASLTAGTIKNGIGSAVKSQ